MLQPTERSKNTPIFFLIIIIIIKKKLNSKKKKEKRLIIIIIIKKKKKKKKLIKKKKEIIFKNLTHLFSFERDLVVEQELDGLDILLVDGVQQGIADLHVVGQQQLDHLDVLVLDGDEQRRAPQRVDAVHVDLVGGQAVEHVARAGHVPPLHGQQVLLLLVAEVLLLADDAHAEAVAVRVDPEVVHQPVGVAERLLVLHVNLVHGLQVTTTTSEIKANWC